MLRIISLVLITILIHSTLSNDDTIEILLFAGGGWAGFGDGGVFRAPNYVGHDVQRPKCAHKCRFGSDQTRIDVADGVLFEAQPLGGYGDDWLREPFELPLKRVGQRWINFGYEHAEYFHLYGEPRWLELIDVNMTFDAANSAVPLSFLCRWGGVEHNADEFLRRHTPSEAFDRERNVAFMSTNCGMGGAHRRTEYVRELMQHLRVESLGQCLHNTDVPDDMRRPIYDDHGSAMRNKIALFERYRFVLAFENNNVTDYVTEKLVNALQSGALPVYMGAPNVEEWLPHPDAVVRTDRFDSPRALADEIIRLGRNRSAYEARQAWRAMRNWPPHFQRKIDQCAFYTAACRLCDHLYALRRSDQRKDVQTSSSAAAVFDGSSLLRVEHTEALYRMFDNALTVVAWIRPTKFGDGLRIVDKNVAGQIAGFNFDLVRAPGDDGDVEEKRAFLRLCGAGACRVGVRPLTIDSDVDGNDRSRWYHVAVRYHHATSTIQFFVNGMLDSTHVTIETLQRNQQPLLIGGAIAPNNAYIAQFHGQIDELSVWSTALDHQVIRQLAFRQVAAEETGLVAAFRMDSFVIESSEKYIENVVRQHCSNALVIGKIELKESSTKPFNINPFI